MGYLDSYVALQMIKHRNTIKLIRCINDRSKCRQVYVKICLILYVISNNTDMYDDFSAYWLNWECIRHDKKPSYMSYSIS